MPRVFLSYSWESDLHRSWVRGLASHLMESGIEVRLDQWDLDPGESITAFMEQEVARADYVVAICTPIFASKSEKRSGGVGYEQQIVSGELLSGTPRSKFIPILRSGELEGDNRAIPLHFSGTFFLDFRDDSIYTDKLEELVRAIFQSPKYQRPSMGNPPKYVQPENSTILQNTLHISLNRELCIEDLDAELLSYEISRIINSGGTPDFIFYSPGYSDEKNELSQSKNLTPQRRLELLHAVENQRILGQDRDSILVESMMLLIKYVYPPLRLSASPTKACKPITKVIERLSLHHDPLTRTTKFDVVNQNHKWSFGIYLSPDEVEVLEQRERTGALSMTLNWGLRIWHLDPTIIREKVAPGMIQEYLWQKYRDKTSPIPDEWFKFEDWQVGIA